MVLQASVGRLCPSSKAGQAIARIGGQCRAIWNHFLAASRDRYQAEQKFVFYTEMSGVLPKLRKEDRYAGLPHRAAQMTVIKLDRALKDCAKRAASRKGFPHFKRRDDRNDTFQFVGRDLRLASGKIRFPAIGWVRVRGLRVPDGARLVQGTVRQCPKGWDIAVQFESAPPVVAPSPVLPVVGVDGGLTHLATFSDSSRLTHPRFARKAAKRLRRLNRERDRRRKGSVNRRRTVARLGRAHRTVACARADYLHKASRRLVNRYAGFAVETLRFRSLMRTRLAKSFADAGLADFLRMLRYKAEWAGREWRTVEMFTRSTGVCPECGTTGERLLLAIREWRCTGCDTIHDRDVAAARVILIRAVGRGTPEPAPAVGRKRGFAVRGGVGARASASHDRPPSNVAETHELVAKQ